jgi:ParB family transcriptional regulator, chromosome partitioning protein
MLRSLPVSTRVPVPVVHLPLADIEEDPDQPRKTFAEEALEELAKSIEQTAHGSPEPWIDGLLHPILVAPSPAYSEGSGTPAYRVLTGARRLRAYRLRAWPFIPARVVAAPRNQVLRILTQLNENLCREATSLYEDCLAVAQAFEAWKLENPKGKTREFSELLGRSAPWVSQRLAVARAQGLGLLAVREGHIQHSEAYREFVQLSTSQQHQLLSRARGSREAITLSRVRELKALGDRGTARTATKPAAAEDGPEPGSDRDSPRPAGGGGRQGALLLLRLRAHEVRLLLLCLDEPAPEEDQKLVVALERALARANLQIT